MDAAARREQLTGRGGRSVGAGSRCNSKPGMLETQPRSIVHGALDEAGSAVAANDKVAREVQWQGRARPKRGRSSTSKVRGPYSSG